MKNGKLTAHELVRLYLDRIAPYDVFADFDVVVLPTMSELPPTIN
jgi:Asp-tRNA(Asn)/Glu-tRNA(Gln) amidotransferase A subunit family amidase